MVREFLTGGKARLQRRSDLFPPPAHPRGDDAGRAALRRRGALHRGSFRAYGGGFDLLPQGQRGATATTAACTYKLDFYAAVFDRLQSLRRRGPVYAVGDYNTAHEAIDLARPKSNVKASGFLPEERAELTRWLSAGWVDTFRARHPGAPGHYTWWRQWGGARERNVGWRIDYVLASPSAAKRLTDAFVWPRVTGSDHCPVGVDLSP